MAYAGIWEFLTNRPETTVLGICWLYALARLLTISCSATLGSYMGDDLETFFKRFPDVLVAVCTMLVMLQYLVAPTLVYIAFSFFT